MTDVFCVLIWVFFMDQKAVCNGFSVAFGLTLDRFYFVYFFFAASRLSCTAEECFSRIYCSVSVILILFYVFKLLCFFLALIKTTVQMVFFFF